MTLHHLGNHIAGAAHDHRVADAHVEPRDLVGVVQRGVGDHHARHVHRRQPRHRRERAGAADLYVDRLQRGGLFLRRELVRHRPARRARNEAQRGLLVESIEFVDDAVDVVGQAVATGADALEVGQQAVGAVRRRHFRAHRKAKLAQLLQHQRVPGRRLPAFAGAQRIGIEAQGPRRGDPGIELAQGSGGAVARIGQRLVAAGAGLRC